MVTTPPGGSSDRRDGFSTGEEEEEEVPMGEEEVDVIGMDDDEDDDDDDDVDVDVDDDKNSEQMVDYCKTFNLIDKGNGVESRYTMANGGGKTHGWTPKLSFRLFNMTLNNAYRIYTCLHKRHRQQEGG